MQETLEAIAELRDQGPAPRRRSSSTWCARRLLDEPRSPAARAGSSAQAVLARQLDRGRGHRHGRARRRSPRRGTRPRPARRPRARAARLLEATGLPIVRCRPCRRASTPARPRARRPAARPGDAPVSAAARQPRQATGRRRTSARPAGAGHRRPHRRPGHPRSSSAAAPAESARPRRPRRSACAPPRQGRTVVVLTIDPARRLAQSLGLTELDNTPRPVAGIDTRRAAARRDDARHEADLRRGRRSPTPSRSKAEQILANPFYQALSQLLRRHAGVHGDGEARPAQGAGRPDAWDLIVVDTPPSRSALDFLDAPERLGRSSTGASSGCSRRRPRPGGRAYLKVFGVGVRLVTRTPDQDPRRRRC